MKALPVLALLMLTGAPAGAQVAVSIAVGNGLAHYCYLDALTSVKTGARLAAMDGLRDCTAALDGGMSAQIRAATYDNRGILNDAQQNYAAAWSDFDTSIRLNARLGDAYLNRGVALLRMQKPDDALGDIQHSMVLGVSMPQAGYYDLGVAEETLGRLPAAYADFQRALASDPGFAPAAEALKNFTVTPAPSAKGG